MPDNTPTTTPATTEKIERKYLAHFLDASFGGQTTNYVRLGKDLEEYNEELNPEVETKNNILGETSVDHKGYKPQAEVSPYYGYRGDALFTHLFEIVNERKTGADCTTTAVDVLLNADGTVAWAYREEVVVIPSAAGGDTSGVQIPFTVYRVGNRVPGSFDLTNKTFTPTTT